MVDIRQIDIEALMRLGEMGTVQHGDHIGQRGAIGVDPAGGVYLEDVPVNLEIIDVPDGQKNGFAAGRDGQFLRHHFLQRELQNGGKRVVGNGLFQISEGHAVAQNGVAAAFGHKDDQRTRLILHQGDGGVIAIGRTHFDVHENDVEKCAVAGI